MKEKGVSKSVAGWPIANEATVIEGYRLLLKEFERWVNARAAGGHEVTYVDGMMVAHNVYKAIIQDLSERVDEPTRARLFGLALKRLATALLSPDESKEKERFFRREGGGREAGGGGG